MTDRFFQDRSTSIQQIMDRWPETLRVLIHYRMLCIGCAVAPFHTLEEACAAHDLDEKTVRARLAEVIDGSVAGSAE